MEVVMEDFKKELNLNRSFALGVSGMNKVSLLFRFFKSK